MVMGPYATPLQQSPYALQAPSPQLGALQVGTQMTDMLNAIMPLLMMVMMMGMIMPMMMED